MWTIRTYFNSRAENLRLHRYNGDIDGFIAGSKVMAEKGPKARHDINPVEVHFSSNNKKGLLRVQCSNPQPYRD